MSGSNSSAPDVLAPPEALEFTVYHVEGPDLSAEARRTRGGRIKMLLVLAVCAAPVILSYITYFVLRPSATSHHGTLIQPSRALPALQLRGLDDRPVAASSLKGQWLLVVAASASCDARCEKLLHAQRQLREMLGRDRDRVDKVWFVLDDAVPSAALRQAVSAIPAVTVLRFPAAELGRWLEAASGHQLSDHLYLVDPMGEWMMRFPADFEPAQVKRDLERLLRASASWDRPGR